MRETRLNDLQKVALTIRQHLDCGHSSGYGAYGLWVCPLFNNIDVDFSSVGSKGRCKN